MASEDLPHRPLRQTVATRWTWHSFMRSLDRVRRPLLALFVLVVAVGSIGFVRVEQNPNVLVYFDPARSDRQEFETVEARFGRVDEIAFLVRARMGTVTDIDGLALIASLQNGAAEIDGVARTRSLLDLGGIAMPSAPDEITLAQWSWQIEQGALQAGDDARAFLSDDHTVGVVSAEVPRDSRAQDGAASRSAIVADAEALRDRLETSAPGFEILMTGRLVIDEVFARTGNSEAARKAVAQALAIVLVLFLVFRSWRVALALMALNGCATVLAMGALGFAGITLQGIASAMPTVLLSVGVATGVHVVLSWQRLAVEVAPERWEGERTGVVAEAVRENAVPVTLSLLTTLISFLCLNFSVSPPFRQLGNVTAGGLAITLVLTFTLLPTILLALPRPKRGHVPLRRTMGGLARAVTHHRRILLALLALCLPLAALGVKDVRFDDVFRHYFDESYEIRRATDLFEDKLIGTTVVTASVPFPERDRTTRIADLGEWIEAQPHVSAVDLPDTEAPNTTGSVRDIDAEGANARIEIVLRDASSADTLAFADALDGRIEELTGPGGMVTGLPILSGRLSIDSAKSMVVATGTAVVAVSLVLLLVLRDLRLGLIALVPNLLPMVAAFALWGALVGNVSFAATIVATLTFGIVVDDTIHFLTRYKVLREGGLSPESAARAAVSTVGAALVVTSFALIAGFAAFGWSGFLVNQHFGLLSAFTIGFALLADILFLPPLLVWLDRDSR